MKVSEITLEDVAKYLRIEYSDPSDLNTTILPNILKVAIEFVKGYTGIYDKDVVDNFTATGTASIFKLSESPIVENTQVVKLNDVVQTVDTDYTIDAVRGVVTFTVIPDDEDEIDVTYEYGLDAFEDFYIAIMVLCQDMYDNRAYYVDSKNLNKVVESVLDMHRINLLPSAEVV